MAETTETPDFINRLPNEILIDEIFGRLETKSRLKARQTCRRWAAAVSISDRQGHLWVAVLPFKIGSDPLMIDTDQIGVALLSILPGEGEKVKVLSFTPDENRLCRLDKATLELIPEFCPNLTCLALMEVEWSSFDGIEFDWLSFRRLAQLSEFHLGSYNRQTNPQKFSADLPQVMSTWRLTELTLFGFSISDGQLAEICRSSPKISVLILSSTSALTDLRPLATLCNLQRLKIGSHQISNDQLKLICSRCLQLSHLHLDGCDSLTDFECVGSLQSLRSLRVGPNFSIAQVILMPQKWWLRDFQCYGSLNDSGLSTLSRQCSGLKSLSLRYCDKITNVPVSDLVVNCPQLELVNLQRTGITGESLQILGKCKFLRSVTLRSKWTPDDILRLQKSRQDNHITTPLVLDLDNLEQLCAGQILFFRCANIYCQ